MTDEIPTAIATAHPVPFWASTVSVGQDWSLLVADIACDLAVVGGGFTGLWSALKARERQPDARIDVLEAGRCG